MPIGELALGFRTPEEKGQIINYFSLHKMVRDLDLDAWDEKEVSIQDLSPVWQYRLRSFKSRDTKLERFLPKNQHHIQRKLLNFENWCSGDRPKWGGVKKCQSLTFRVNFNVKNHWNHSQFFIY